MAPNNPGIVAFGGMSNQDFMALYHSKVQEDAQAPDPELQDENPAETIAECMLEEVENVELSRLYKHLTGGRLLEHPVDPGDREISLSLVVEAMVATVQK
jgi:hypothetical protein